MSFERADRKWTLISSDGEEFEVKEVVALESQVIKNRIEDKGDHVIGNNKPDTKIRLPNVTSSVLSKVIKYCKKHVDVRETGLKGGEVKSWDDNFIKRFDQAALFDLQLAANYLNIRGLLDLTSWKIADIIRGKTTEEIRDVFGIKNDFTEEEERQFRGVMERARAFDCFV